MLVSLLIPCNVLAQEEPSPVQFNGSNVLEGQYANRKGYNSEMPKDFLRNDLQMTLSVFDTPIATSFFITTGQADHHQKINNLRFYIDLPTLKKNRARIEAQNKANNLPDTKAPFMLRFLSNFSKIEAGRFRPDYGELTLQGISVSGVNLEFTNKIVYAAFASGNIKRPTDKDSTHEATYKQKLMFGKFGFGDKRTTHFYMTYMKIEDETPAPVNGLQDTATVLKPQSNVIIGAEFRLSFLKNIWVIDGDAGVSALTRDTRILMTYDSVIVDSLLKRVPKFLVDAVNPNISTSADYAFGINTKLNLKTTTISGGYRRIGPGYFTLGNPMLVNDRQTFEGRVDQALLKRRLSVSAYYKRYNDNLIKWKNGRTNSTAFGIIAKYSLKKGPYFQISFTPNYQETNGENQSIRNKMNIFSFSTGYKYLIGQLNSITNLGYFNQNADFERDTLSQNTSTQTFTLNQILDFTQPFQVNFNAGYTIMKSTIMNNTTSDRNVISLVLSGTYTYKKNWRNTIGWKYLNSNGESFESKYSFFWDTQVNIWKYMDFGLGIDENIFKTSSKTGENYNEFIVQCKLILKW